MEYANLKQFIGKNHKDLETYLGLTHYIETKDYEDFKRINPDHELLVKAFLEFCKSDKLETVRFHDGTIEEFPLYSPEDIGKNLILLKNNKGLFNSPDDDELATSYGFFTNDYIAEFMQGIIFFSGKEEKVEEFSKILANYKILHFPPKKISSFYIPDSKPTVYVKLGKNDKCHCGSEIKYKKCCMEKDIKETGKVRKVNS